MSEIVLALTTVPEDLDADRFARTLVESGHAACVSVLPMMTSTYRWQGAVESARERQVVIKTTTPQVGALEAAIRSVHPYDVPEFLVVPVTGGSAAYLAWLRGEETGP